MSPDAEGVAEVIRRAGPEALEQGIVYDERYLW